MRILDLLRDFHIDHVTEHKNVRSGWVGVHCPFCPGEPNYHLGYNMDEKYFSCWRCGGKNEERVIIKLLGVSNRRAEEIIKQYGGESRNKTEPRIRVGTNKFQLPNGPMELQRQHKRYLESRGFDWEKLEDVWGILGTGPVARLDELNYANRILAPITWDGRSVSFQARDITNKHMAKYMACPPEREIISHKHILYGRPDRWGDRGLGVEGITDVWRLGLSAFATFGIKFTFQQIRAMAKIFKEVIILFDPESFAQEHAQNLIKELRFKGLKVWKEVLECDPGDLKQDDADHLVRQLLK